MNPWLISHIQDGGFADIKNCWYYFTGKIADKFSKLKHLSNYIDTLVVCKDMAKMSTRQKLPIRFKTDEQIFDFLNIYKSSKLICLLFTDTQK